MQMRPHTYDDSMVRDGRASYRKLAIEKGDVVLDLGAHIGGFAIYAIGKGASRVVCYEPEASNAALLRANTVGQPVEVRERGVWSESGTLQLNVTTGPHTGHHSFVIDSSQRLHLPVEVEAFGAILEDVRPQRIKIDIEGAEHQLRFADLPASVRGLAMEIEMSRGTWVGDAQRIDDEMTAQGFRTVRHVWSAYGVWVWLR